jgi:hypothetical protein
MQCATHPDTETELACSRCEKPICPRCLIHTPVGARCRECANVRRLPQYNLSTATYVRAVGAAVASGGVLGVAWWFFNLFTFVFGLFAVIAVGLGLGYVVGEAVAMATNRRRGPPLQIIAVGGVILAYVVRTALLLVVDGIGFGELRVVDAFSLVAVVFAGFIAVQRLR